MVRRIGDFDRRDWYPKSKNGYRKEEEWARFRIIEETHYYFFIIIIIFLANDLRKIIISFSEGVHTTTTKTLNRQECFCKKKPLFRPLFGPIRTGPVLFRVIFDWEWCDWSQRLSMHITEEPSLVWSTGMLKLQSLVISIQNTTAHREIRHVLIRSC